MVAKLEHPGVGGCLLKILPQMSRDSWAHAMAMGDL